jgi:non-homologous end joining protein Ku
LERLPASVPRHLSGRAVAGHLGEREDLVQQLNRQTGHRIKYLKVDADTGEEVPNEDIVKGYMLDKETFVEVSKEELEEIALESMRTIEIDEFVERDEIDPRYLIRPYYFRPDGKVGHDAFAVIRETIREMDKVAISRVVLTNREHIIALEPLRRSVGGAAAETKAPKKSAKKPRKPASGQKEMLMPIAGKKPAKETTAKRPAARPQRKSA